MERTFFINSLKFVYILVVSGVAWALTPARGECGWVLRKPIMEKTEGGAHEGVDLSSDSFLPRKSQINLFHLSNESLFIRIISVQ